MELPTHVVRIGGLFFVTRAGPGEAEPLHSGARIPLGGLDLDCLPLDSFPRDIRPTLSISNTPPSGMGRDQSEVWRATIALAPAWQDAAGSGRWR